MNPAVETIREAIPTATVSTNGYNYEVKVAASIDMASEDFLTVYALLAPSTEEWNLKFTLQDEEKAVLVTASSSLDMNSVLESILLLNHALERQPSNVMIDAHTGICRMVSENYFDSDSDQAYMTDIWRSSAKRTSNWVNPPAVIRHVV